MKNNFNYTKKPLYMQNHMKYEKNFEEKFSKLYLKNIEHGARSAMTEIRAPGVLKFLFLMQM